MRLAGGKGLAREVGLARGEGGVGGVARVPRQRGAAREDGGRGGGGGGLTCHGRRSIDDAADGGATVLLHVGVVRVRAQRRGDKRHRAERMRLRLALLGLGSRAANQVRERCAAVLLYIGVVEVAPQRRHEQRHRPTLGYRLAPQLGRLVGAVDEREERKASCFRGRRGGGGLSRWVYAAGGSGGGEAAAAHRGSAHSGRRDATTARQSAARWRPGARRWCVQTRGASCAAAAWRA